MTAREVTLADELRALSVHGRVVALDDALEAIAGREAKAHGWRGDLAHSDECQVCGIDLHLHPTAGRGTPCDRCSRPAVWEAVTNGDHRDTWLGESQAASRKRHPGGARWPLTFDAMRVAESALNRCCAGDQWPTARRLAAFQWALLRLSARRFVNRTDAQGWRSLLRWRTP